MLVQPRRGSNALAGLQMLASGVTTLLSFAVALLAVAFWNVPSDDVGYSILAIALVGLLIVPLVTLGTAAARLAARRRDERLATLRLLGAAARRVRRIAVAEATLIAACGVLLGSLVSLALPFGLKLLTVYGRPLTPSELWLPWWMSAAIPPVLVLLTAFSALLGLKRVILSPFGVRTRQDAPRMSWLRPVIAVAVLVAAVLVTQNLSPGWGVTVMVGAMTVTVLAVMAALGVVGPFVVSLLHASPWLVPRTPRASWPPGGFSTTRAAPGARSRRSHSPPSCSFRQGASSATCT